MLLTFYEQGRVYDFLKFGKHDFQFGSWEQTCK